MHGGEETNTISRVAADEDEPGITIIKRSHLGVMASHSPSPLSFTLRTTLWTPHRSLALIPLCRTVEAEAHGPQTRPSCLVAGERISRAVPHLKLGHVQEILAVPTGYFMFNNWL